MYKEDLDLNNPQGLIYHKTQPTITLPVFFFLFFFLVISWQNNDWFFKNISKAF